jgi:shikimate dehydrogenase
MRRYGLLGYPLTHSFSQKYFTEKFLNLGLNDCVYENYSLQDINELKAVLDAHPDICGINITIPHKRNVLQYLTDPSKVVQDIGACNCIHFKAGKAFGYNTDVVGFEQSLQPFLKPYHQKALILGTGGASSAVEYVLKGLNIEVQFVSRVADDDCISYNMLNEDIMSSHHLIINTTPLGMYPKVEERPEIPYQYLSAKHHLCDLTYNPPETKFLELGRLQGATTQNGAEMLVLQAEESWRIWNS